MPDRRAGRRFSVTRRAKHDDAGTIAAFLEVHTMRLHHLTLAASIALLLALVLPLRAVDVPEPSPYPITWEFTFNYQAPRRIIVNLAGAPTPKAYWYMPYAVTNEGEDTHVLIPEFELLTEDGRLHKAMRVVPIPVFNAIRSRERNNLMVPPTRIEGPLRPGVDQARDSVAVWEEPSKDMGTFRVFVSGLSGEFVELKDDAGKALTNAKGDPLILRKTLQLTYRTDGDEVYPGEDVVREGETRINKNAKAWVMR